MKCIGVAMEEDIVLSERREEDRDQFVQIKY